MTYLVLLQRSKFGHCLKISNFAPNGQNLDSSEKDVDLMPNYSVIFINIKVALNNHLFD